MRPSTLLSPAAFAANRWPRRHRQRCRCHRATTATNATIMIELTVIDCRRKRQQQQHHQRTNGSTSVKTFTSLDDLDLFNLSTVFDVCDVGRGNLAISKLLAKKKCTFFAIYILQDVLLYEFNPSPDPGPKR
jgi:hypothetical protein